MPSRPRRALASGLAVVIAVLALALVVRWRGGGEGGARRGPSDERSVAAEPNEVREREAREREARLEASPDPDGEPSEGVIERGGSPPPRSSAVRRSLGEVDPCAELDERAPRPERLDRLDELVNARLGELSDRARLALGRGSTSAPLRRAIEAVLVRRRDELSEVEPAFSAPDRMEDGFDFAVALELTIAVRARRERARVAEQALDRATRAAPRDPIPWVLLAMIRAEARDRAGQREALRQAFEREPREPAIALELGRALARSVDVARGIEALDVVLGSDPENLEAARLRARFVRRRDGVGEPSRETSAQGVTVLHPADLDRARVLELADVVSGALTEFARALDLPRREELAIFVYRDHEAMIRAMCGQGWTAAAYDGVLHVERGLASDATSAALRRGVLRHETLHAALDEVRLPFWADEGLAQHVSGLVDPSAARDDARLVRDRVWVPFASLEGAFLDIDDPSDARLAYHQSRAMIEWLVARRGERVLAELVTRLAARPAGAFEDPTVVLSELGRRRFDGDELLAFLASR